MTLSFNQKKEVTKMIQYGCQDKSDYWLCFMTELWHSPNSCSCKTFLHLPGGARYIDVHCVYVGSDTRVVAVPDMEISFCSDCTKKDIDISSILQTNVDMNVAYSISKTVEVMEYVLSKEGERYDDTTNFAAGCEPLEYELYKSPCSHSEEALPF